MLYKGDFEKEGVLESKVFNNVYYIKLNSFIEFIEAAKFEDPVLRKVQFSIDNSEIKITADNPFILIRSELYQIPMDTKFYDNQIYIPIKYFAGLLNKYLPGEYRFDETELIFEIMPGTANITGIEIEEKINGTLIRIKSNKIFGREISSWISQASGWLYLQVYGGIVDSLSLASNHPRGIISKIVPEQLPESAQIAFRLRKRLEKKDFSVMQDPVNNEILVTISRPGRKQKTISELEKQKDQWNVDTIVIDPGHGGRDPGCVGYRGYKEKDIALAIALKLGRILKEKHGLNVIYTRKTDVFVPLWKRTEIAIKNEGKLFVSIHINSSKNRKIYGFETYFLRPGKNEDALEVMKRENSVIHLEDTQERYKDYNNENLMLFSILQSGFMKESEQLAIMLTEGFNKSLGRGNRGVKQAGFFVLYEASMPNALVEAGFLSNSREAQRLVTSSYQEKIAEGLMEGIIKFISNIRS